MPAGCSLSVWTHAAAPRSCCSSTHGPYPRDPSPAWHCPGRCRRPPRRSSGRPPTPLRRLCRQRVGCGGEMRVGHAAKHGDTAGGQALRCQPVFERERERENPQVSARVRVSLRKRGREQGAAVRVRNEADLCALRRAAVVEGQPARVECGWLCGHDERRRGFCCSLRAAASYTPQTSNVHRCAKQ
jgi:hypothetical protein